jgi:hypothetical protein
VENMVDASSKVKKNASHLAWLGRPLAMAHSAGSDPLTGAHALGDGARAAT